MAAGRRIRFLAGISAAVLLLATVPPSAAAPAGEIARLQAETLIAYRGERYSLSVTLPGRWLYQTDPAEDGLQLMVRRDPEERPLRADILTFTERATPEEFPPRHRARWAAERYLEAELDSMGALGVDTGMYDLADVETGSREIDGRTFYTMTYRQIFPATGEGAYENHAWLYLYFPADYTVRRHFYLVHYLHTHEAGGEDIATAESMLGAALAGLSAEPEAAPRESTVTWQTPDRRYVAVVALDRDRTYYFENDSEHQCFAFAVDGLWNPGDRPGLFMTLDAPGYAGVELVAAERAAEMPGEDPVARASQLRLSAIRAQGAEVIAYREEPAGAVHPGARRCSVTVTLEFEGERRTFSDVWYAAEVRTGWIAVVDAMREPALGDDDLARALFTALEFSDEPDCFREGIDRLLN